MRGHSKKPNRSFEKTVNDSRGFSLIELLIAIAFIGVSLAAVATLVAGVTRGGQQSKNVTGAVTLMQDKLEEFKNASYSAITSGSETSIDSEGNAGGAFNRSWTVTTTGSAKEITVTVTWPYNGVTKTRSMTTIISE